MNEALLFDERPQVIAVLTPDEAAQMERDIITTGNRLRVLLVEFYERRGWAALGYGSWRSWAAARLGQSENMAYRALLAGQVEVALFDDSQKIGTLPETHLRPLVPLRNNPPALRETWARANEIAEERGETRKAQHVTQAVQERVAPPAEPPRPAPMAVHFSSATPEWYTPPHIVQRVVDMFGHIDLDPCSNAQGAAAAVPARYHYTAADNGLAQSWRVPFPVDDDGKEMQRIAVYMNPPYGDEIGAWTERLACAYASGEITEAIALLPARTDTAWCQPLLRAAASCFVRGRLKFSGAENSAPFPSLILYLGTDIDLFRELFSDLGVCK